jgi:hypothetical protein
VYSVVPIPIMFQALAFITLAVALYRQIDGGSSLTSF